MKSDIRRLCAEQMGRQVANVKAKCGVQMLSSMVACTAVSKLLLRPAGKFEPPIQTSCYYYCSLVSTLHIIRSLLPPALLDDESSVPRTYSHYQKVPRYPFETRGRETPRDGAGRDHAEIDRRIVGKSI